MLVKGGTGVGVWAKTILAYYQSPIKIHPGVQSICVACPWDMALKEVAFVALISATEGISKDEYIWLISVKTYLDRYIMVSVPDGLI